MRYSEDLIRNAICHPRIEVCIRAIHYFARSYSSDTSLMPLAIQAIEAHRGEQPIAWLLNAMLGLVQTAETVDWLVGELDRTPATHDRLYRDCLGRMLAGADLALIVKYEQKLRSTKWDQSHPLSGLSHRFTVQSWGAEKCWQSLLAFCEQHKTARTIGEVNLDFPKALVERLAQVSDGYESRTCELLSQEIVDYTDHPMGWLEPMLIRLCGLARWTSSIPLLVRKLADDAGDLGNEECQKALTRISTPAVLKAVCDVYPTSEDHFRIYSSGVLEDTHLPESCDRIWELYEGEPDDEFAIMVAEAWLNQYPRGHAARIYSLLQDYEMEGEVCQLRSNLLTTCEITGERFVDFESWSEVQRRENAEMWKTVANVADEIDTTMAERDRLIEENEQLREKLEVQKKIAASLRLAASQKMNAAKAEPYGRNSPCRCGSGKKFKKCCGRD